jgi:hypothetical protein
MTSVDDAQFPQFIPLREAADAIGRKMYGRSWRPIKEIGIGHIPSDEELVGAGYHLLNKDRKVDPDAAKHARTRFASSRRAEIILSRADDAIEGVIGLLARRCETGEIGTGCRSIDGVEILDCSVWRASNWRSYFVDGEIERDLPLLDHKQRPVGDGRTARCRHKMFVRREDLGSLIDALPGPQRAPRRRGRSPVLDWVMVGQEVHRLMEEHGEFVAGDPAWNVQARLEAEISDYCETTFGKRPAESVIRTRSRSTIGEAKRPKINSRPFPALSV